MRLGRPGAPGLIGCLPGGQGECPAWGAPIKTQQGFKQGGGTGHQIQHGGEVRGGLWGLGRGSLCSAHLASVKAAMQPLQPDSSMGTPCRRGPFSEQETRRPLRRMSQGRVDWQGLPATPAGAGGRWPQPQVGSLVSQAQVLSMEPGCPPDFRSPHRLPPVPQGHQCGP